MKFFIVFSTVFVQVKSICSISCNTRQDCQAICDLATDCGAWDFIRDEKKCYLKHRFGWCPNPGSGNDSGFKDAGQFYLPNTILNGGNLDC